MGYDTRFRGCFYLNEKLSEKLKKRLDILSNTTRIQYDVVKIAKKEEITYEEAIERYGTQGEFYFVDDCDVFKLEYLQDKNTKHRLQPDSKQCHWQYNEEKNCIEFNEEGEKFYKYVEWIQYIIDDVLSPFGYVLNGTVLYAGDERYDNGMIEITNNIVKVHECDIFFQKVSL